MSKVFISYSHDSAEHSEKVLALSERLRADGIDTILDRYVNGSPVGGWPRWMLDQLDVAEHVLVVCTETYYRRFRGKEMPGKGRGVDWEGALITQEIYDSRTTTLKFVPVLFVPEADRFIPEPLRAGNFYQLTSEQGYQALYDFLLGQAGVEPGPIGSLKAKRRLKVHPLKFDDDAEPPVKTRKPIAPLMTDTADENYEADVAEDRPDIPQRKQKLPPPPPPLALNQILPGRWQVQIQMQFAPVSGQLNVEMFANGMFNGQLMSPMGMVSVSGQWQVNPLVNQIGLQGMQTNGYQTMPYIVMVQVNFFDGRHIAGVTSAGETVNWQRVG